MGFSGLVLAPPVGELAAELTERAGGLCRPALAHKAFRADGDIRPYGM